MLGSPSRAWTRVVAVRSSRSTSASSSVTAVSRPVGVARVRCPPVRAQLGVHGLVELGARLFGAVVRRVGVALGLADLVGVGVGVGDLAGDVGVDRVFDAAPVQPHHLVCELGGVGGQVGHGGAPAFGERGQLGAGVADLSAVLAESPGAVTDDLGGSLAPVSRSWRQAAQIRVWRSAVSALSAASRSTTCWRASSQRLLALASSPRSGGLGRACSGRGSRRPAGGRRVRRPGVGVGRGGRPAGSRRSTGRRGPPGGVGWVAGCRSARCPRRPAAAATVGPRSARSRANACSHWRRASASSSATRWAMLSCRPRVIAT